MGMRPVGSAVETLPWDQSGRGGPSHAPRRRHLGVPPGPRGGAADLSGGLAVECQVLSQATPFSSRRALSSRRAVLPHGRPRSCAGRLGRSPVAVVTPVGRQDEMSGRMRQISVVPAHARARSLRGVGVLSAEGEPSVAQEDGFHDLSFSRWPVVVPGHERGAGRYEISFATGLSDRIRARAGAKPVVLRNHAAASLRFRWVG